MEFERNLGEMVSQFIEVAQVHFTVIKEHEKLLSEVLRDLVMRFLTHYTTRKDDLARLPATLQLVLIT